MDVRALYDVIVKGNDARPVGVPSQMAIIFDPFTKVDHQYRAIRKKSF